MIYLNGDNSFANALVLHSPSLDMKVVSLVGRKSLLSDVTLCTKGHHLLISFK